MSPFTWAMAALHISMAMLIIGLFVELWYINKRLTARADRLLVALEKIAYEAGRTAGIVEGQCGDR